MVSVHEVTAADELVGQFVTDTGDPIAWVDKPDWTDLSNLLYDMGIELLANDVITTIELSMKQATNHWPAAQQQMKELRGRCPHCHFVGMLRPEWDNENQCYVIVCLHCERGVY